MSYNNSPYKEGGAGFNESTTGFIQPPRSPPKKRGLSPWIKFGVPVVVVAAVAAIVAGVLISKNKTNSSGKSDASKADGSSGDKDGNTSSAGVATATNKLEAGRFATATNSKYMIPVYPSATNQALFTQPTFAASADTWPADPFKPTNPSPTVVREDRPRLIAPAYKWQALPSLIQSDPYLKGWNETIFRNASDYWSAPVITYNLDGPSGILDNAREFKMRIKAFGYAWRLTQNTRWADRAYQEIQHVVSPTFGTPGDDKWNPSHFLDTAEFSAAFGIAYDWMYDIWDDAQKQFIRDNLVRYGLNHGIATFTASPPPDWQWWSTVNGNWNCVCNGGLTLAALAILGDDTTGVASALLSHTIDNAKANCARAVTTDGSWMESPNYWYFGTTGHAEMTSALLTATGSSYGLLDSNPDFWKTGTYHMAVFGPTSLFQYGDHGPNKFSTTANSMLLYGDQLQHPEFILHQREQADAAEPWSMFWYNPSVSGAFWSGLPLDHFFDAPAVQWASMRSSWTDPSALYIGIKAGLNEAHQTHNDLDIGDFVIDALGTRWAGELGSGDYNAKGFFNSPAQDSERWKYYRKHTMGQNTVMVASRNQDILAKPSVVHGSSETRQGSSTVFEVPGDSTAFWVADISSAYFDATMVKRGARLLTARKQILLQDEITAQGDIQWRMHTNATIAISSTGTSAELTLDGETLSVSLLDPPAGAQFTVQTAERHGVEPVPEDGDQENVGVEVLVVALGPGTYTLRVLFSPHWPGGEVGGVGMPPAVALDEWTLRSHD